LSFTSFFKRLPLAVKLMLIGLIPLILLIYLSTQLISEQDKKLDLLNGYMKRINQSSDISQLSTELQAERRYSFEHALRGGLKNEMIRQRDYTDTALQKLKSNYSETLGDFQAYTFISDINGFRNSFDNGKVSANAIMHYYTTAVFRLNTMNTVAVVNNPYLEPVYQDMISQKIISEMITYLAIIRTNIYNVLYTKKYMVETLMGTLGTYDVYKTYERELMLKAPPDLLSDFNHLKKNSTLRPTLTYIDTVFKTYRFDSTYSYQEWWNISLSGVDQLRRLQENLLNKVQQRINKIYNQQQKARSRTILLITLMIILGIGIILYTTRSITIMLLELKKAAQRIAQGATGIHLQNISNDVIGSLSDSILRIDKANRTLADAAESIGKGKFDVPVKPRSKEDVLGNAIIQMKNDLQRFTGEMIELEKRKDTFITMASHELKTPITSIKGYVQLLLKMVNEQYKKGENISRPLLHTSLLTIDKQVSKLTRLITELLDLSKIETGQFDLNRQRFNLNDLVVETIKDLQQTTSNHLISFENGVVIDINADRDRIGQVITNILTNAIKYSPRADKIEVQIYPVEGREIAVSIRDYGIGIEKNDQHKIFERFYRAEGDKEKTFPGFGIGLFIASEIIQRHKGKIKVDSEPGKGSVFTVILPLKG
jgi:signal transduction histidine kinase